MHDQLNLSHSIAKKEESYNNLLEENKMKQEKQKRDTKKHKGRIDIEFDTNKSGKPCVKLIFYDPNREIPGILYAVNIEELDEAIKFFNKYLEVYSKLYGEKPVTTEERW